MPDYTKHAVWHVQIDGTIDVEASSQEEAIERGQALLIAGEGELTATATLSEAFIEIPAP